MSDTPVQPQAKKRRWRVTRRGFLIGLGAAGGALALGVTLGRRPFYRFLAGVLDGAEGAPASFSDDPFAWFEISPDNRITLFVSKVEMGQGIHTAIAQIGAEELGIEFEQLSVVQAGTLNGPGGGLTGGSNSVSSVYEPLRRTAATLREMLVAAAGRQWGVETAALEAHAGTVRRIDDPQQALTYGEIVAATAEWPELETEPLLKSADQYRFIGQSIPRVDFDDKLTGKAVYGYDARVEGMLYGAVARPPRVAARMVAAAPGDAASRPGVVEVVIDAERQFAGVVARTRQQAWAAVNALDVTWDEGPAWSQAEIEGLLDFEQFPGYTIQKEGNAPREIGEDGPFTAEYFTPLAAHAHLEAQAALVDVQDGRVRVWGSTQAQDTVQGEIASLLGVDADTVEVIPTYLGGGFGRKLNIEAANEAALLSRAAGRPVHVGWSRTEDMRYGYFRPPTRSRLSAKLDNGRITAINHDHISAEVAFASLPDFLGLVIGTDFGAWRGAMNFYGGIENRWLTTHLAKIPVRTSWWRGLGLLANVFATESFMDELAHAAGADPLQFRLDHLGSDDFGRRMRGVLVAAAERAGYGRELPAGRAFGLACSTDIDTVAAMVAEVTLGENGQVVVPKVTMAVDAGLFVNPDGAKAQSQGSVIMGLSSTLLEELTIEEGQVVPANFDGYPLLALDQAPDIDIILLESDGKPRGMGEPPMGPVAAAVANGVFNLTGRRLRRLPLRL